MGISIQQYRSRIGKYLPNIHSRVQSQPSQKYVQKLPRFLVSLVTFGVMVPTIVICFIFILSQQDLIKPSQLSCNLCYPVSVHQISIFIELSNFSARYLYGNKSNKQANGIKIAHLNKGPGFLGTKISDIEHAVSNLKPHILGISEANFFYGHDIEEVQLSEYSFHVCPTISNKNLGYSRVVVYVHNSVVYKIREDLMSNNYSSIWVQIGLPGKKQILVCHTYREWQVLQKDNVMNSSNSVDDQLQRWLLFLDQWEKALNSGMEVIVCGDINLNHLDWGLPHSQQSSQTKKLRPLIEELFQKILPLGVVQCVTVATRFMIGQPQTGLDHFYTTCSEKLSPVNAVFWGGPDHKMIFGTRHSKLLNKNPRYVKKRSFKTFNPDAFLEDISKLYWWDIYQCDNVDTAVHLFTQRFSEVLDKHAPMKIFQFRRNYAPWISLATRDLMKQRNEAQA